MTEYPRRTCAAVLLRPLFERLAYHQRSLSFLHSFLLKHGFVEPVSKADSQYQRVCPEVEDY
jgi:hypothetical protein